MKRVKILGYNNNSGLNPVLLLQLYLCLDKKESEPIICNVSRGASQVIEVSDSIQEDYVLELGKRGFEIELIK